MESEELRFGSIADIYYALIGEKMPKQMDLLDIWFPDLIIAVDESDGNTKVPAEYKDLEYKIHAVRYKGRLYSGESKRVSQILGRLTGTAAGNKEKERKTAELIQKHVVEQFIVDMELTPRLKDHVDELFQRLTDDQLEELYQFLLEHLYELIHYRKSLDDYHRKTEPFPFDDEVFDSILYDAAYQLNLESYEGLRNAYLWLLTGGLLRNETGRILRMYDSSFIAIYRQQGATEDIEDKLNYLFYPENYHSFYTGDDLEKQFPGIEWYCDQCRAHLNEQEGFDDHLPEWTCTQCGYINPIGIDQIYETEEDYRHGVRKVDHVDFAHAIDERRKEIEEEKNKES